MQILSELSDLLYPLRCYGCKALGIAICSECRREWIPHYYKSQLSELNVHSALLYTPTASKVILAAKENGIETFATLEEMPVFSVDVVISNHALEHVHDPLGVLQKICRTLRPGGRLVLVTPFERSTRWKPGDINQHLYTWSPMNLGNLVSLAGFNVESVELINHRFPPGGITLRRLIGSRLFHILCLFWGRLYRPVSQVRVVALSRDD